MLKPPQKPLMAVFIPLLLACTPPSAVQAGDRALLIGINQYNDPAVRKLYGTLNDLQAFHTMLIQQLNFKEAEIRELKDTNATHDGILQAIDNWLVKGSAPGNRVVLYYSGHGDQTDDTNGDEKDNLDEALVAHDADLATHKNYVLDDGINQKIQALKGREVLVVIDSCHSDTATRGLSTVPYEDAKTPGRFAASAITRGGELEKAHQVEGNFLDPAPQLTAFFAVSTTQLALETRRDPRHPQGVFTGAFVDGANGKADKNQDGQVSYAELLDYIRARSHEYCQANNCPQGLDPNMEAPEFKMAQNFRDFGLANPTMPTNPVQAVEAIFPHGNEAGLSLTLERGDHTLEPGEPLRLGDPVHYQFRTGRAGKLVIFDMDADGKLTQLFPSATLPAYTPVACRKSMGLTDRVPAGQTLRIPDGCMGIPLSAQEPVGKGKVVAVLIEDESIDTRNLILTPPGAGQSGVKSTIVQIPQGEQWMTALRNRLDQVFHAADGTNRAVNWSVLAVDYEIIR